MTSIKKQIDLKTVTGVAKDMGLNIVGSANLSFLESQRERLISWQNRGFAGDMKFMLKSPDLFVDPKLNFPGAQGVLSFCINYDRSTPNPSKRGFGRVARYAWGRDYHKVIPKLLKQFVSEISKRVAYRVDYRIISDAAPILERALAVDAALGFIGKNTMLIRPGEGSFMFLGEILWDLEIIPEEASKIGLMSKKLLVLDRQQSCGSCQRCLTDCPTAAFVEPFVLDAKRCISYLSIERRGSFSAEEREALGDWIFGCDVCQEVCPFNHAGLKRELTSDFEALGVGAGVGPYLSIKEVLGIREDARFLELFAGTPLMRAKREGLVRNGICVAVNTGIEELMPDLLEAFQEDSSEVVRQHALWAIWRLGGDSRSLRKPQLEYILEKARVDPSDLVKDELSSIKGEKNVTN